MRTAKKIKPRSKKRQAEERQYRKIRDKFLHTHFRCQCCCQDNSSTVHHMRGRTGDLLTDERYFLAVCFDCHRRIELNPKWAKENGYSLSRLAKEL